MSYILDALTKSQQERRHGGVPTLSTPQLTVNPAKGAHTRYVNGALIAVTGAAVLFAVQALTRRDDPLDVVPKNPADAPTGAALKTTVVSPPEPSSPPTLLVAETAGPSAPATRQAAPATAAASPIPSPPPKPAGRRDFAFTDAPIASPPRPAAPAEKAGLGTDSSAASTAPPPMPSEEATLRSIEERLFPGGAEAPHPETVRLAEQLLELASRPVPRSTPSSVPRDAPGLSDRIPPPESTMAPSSAQRVTTAAPAPSPSAAGANAMATAPRASDGGDVLPRLRALPSDVQASLGRLTINAHVYSDVPAGRMVVINMNRYQEGETLREGPRIEAITTTGAVLSYQSYRFRLSMR